MIWFEFLGLRLPLSVQMSTVGPWADVNRFFFQFSEEFNSGCPRQTGGTGAQMLMEH
ncbi:hypothetical protein M758_2G093000 [Ceratodon purpureus]|uniref:Uncharacterized protein n=1 Tax=Ceratodon purpureus TaxID=3225 RepID=A0A8T0IUA3_CERPU|nr:hypothetical protein KC19_2G075500 [Ceratodon purpureus]KAG0625976.1 hypothetical protein M758_2G093000 [Ceratodon purpureus]